MTKIKQLIEKYEAEIKRLKDDSKFNRLESSYQVVATLREVIFDLKMINEKNKN